MQSGNSCRYDDTEDVMFGLGLYESLYLKTLKGWKILHRKTRSTTLATQYNHWCFDLEDEVHFFTQLVSAHTSPKDHHQHLLVCINNAQDRLEQYYERMQESPAYVASVVLNSQHKRHWFNFHWKANRLDWIEEAQQNVKRLWPTNYKDIQSRDEPSRYHSIDAR